MNSLLRVSLYLRHETQTRFLNSSLYSLLSISSLNSTRFLLFGAYACNHNSSLAALYSLVSSPLSCFLLRYSYHFPVSCSGIPVSVSSCLHELFWSPLLLSVSCPGIPVFCCHHIFLVRIISSFLQRILLLHISQLLLPL